ncbi:MAG: hypothetical protein RL380_1162 [Verrucomicrobiota bacterium]|jgi:hypothetical protein
MSDETEILPSQGRYSARATEVIKILDERIDDVYRQVQAQPFWHTLLDAKTSNETCLKIFREVFLAIYWYQKHTTEAGFHMIGRLPKSETVMLKLTTLHKVEESEHGEWALRDYGLLGGDKGFAIKTPPNPATFAVTGVWWRMAVAEEPLGYFGAEYLFEYLTLVVAQPLVALFKQRGFKADGLRFIIDHATEDEKHAKLVRHLICDAVTRYPESEAAMIRCFDYFRQVYPLPVWTEAYNRAMTK